MGENAKTILDWGRLCGQVFGQTEVTEFASNQVIRVVKKFATL